MSHLIKSGDERIRRVIELNGQSLEIMKIFYRGDTIFVTGGSFIILWEITKGWLERTDVRMVSSDVSRVFLGLPVDT